METIVKLCGCGCFEPVKNVTSRFLSGHYAKWKSRIEEESKQKAIESGEFKEEKVEKICACGCEQFVKSINHTYINGHHLRGRKRSEEEEKKRLETKRINSELGSFVDKFKLCACGRCGETVSPGRKYVHGHNRGGITRFVSVICNCGICGLMTVPGKKFVHGHNSRGVRDTTNTNNKNIKKRNVRVNEKFGSLISVVCGCRKCGRMTTPGKKFIKGHSSISSEQKAKISAALVGRPRPAHVRNKLSISGKKSFAEGRSVPNGNGNKIGISGCRNGMIFASTSELSLILEYEKNGRISSLVRADRGKYHFIIPYGEDGRTFHPDFFDLDFNKGIEVKDPGIEESEEWPIVEMKIQAGEKFMKDLGNSFELRKMPGLSKKKVVFPMRERYEIQLDDKWEKQYWEWCFEMPVSFSMIETVA